MSRVLDCSVLLRMYTMVMSGLYAYTSLFEPDTLTYEVAHADHFAVLTMCALGILAVLGMADLVVNDIMPERFSMLRALDDRHLVSMAISACFGIQMSVCVRYQLPHAVLPFYAVYAVMVPASAFADVRKRYKQKKAC